MVVKLGVWVSNTKSRRDKLSAEQLAALAELGVDWAVTAPKQSTKSAPAPTDDSQAQPGVPKVSPAPTR